MNCTDHHCLPLIIPPVLKPEVSATEVLAAAVAEQRALGPVVSARLAAEVIGVSRQRVYQFLREGRLQRCQVLRWLIPVRSLEQFLATPRGCGLRWQQGDLFPSGGTVHE